MKIFPSMKNRSYEPELMDDPHCDTQKLLRTVKQFELLNRLFSRSRTAIKKYILSQMVDKNRTYRVLDIGAGGGDIAVWLVKECRKRGLSVHVVCLDSDKIITAYAETRTAAYEEISVVHGTAFDLNSHGIFDFVFANHFLHHLTYEDIAELLPKIQKITQMSCVLNDLRRSRLAFLGYTIFTALFLKNSFVFYDGRLSIERGFTKKELQEYLPLETWHVEELPPARYVLIYNANE